MNRRDFLTASAGGALLSVLPESFATARTSAAKAGSTRVALVRSRDRATAVGRVLRLLGHNPVAGQPVLIKPNLNTADPFPASTHIDTLEQLILSLRQMGCGPLTIGERSGPPPTARVIRDLGVDRLCMQQQVELINFEELPHEDWVRIRPPDSHWRDGFDVARPVLEASSVVATCCLKTHGYGGVFTMSLKLAVGITHKRNMAELHGNKQHMRRMIAEINQAYRPALILLDGIDVFTDGGPMHGTRKAADVMLAGTDRVAVDVVGLAVLKELGSNREIMETPFFSQEQIARAVELGLGIGVAEQIELVTDDQASEEYAQRLTAILRSNAG